VPRVNGRAHPHERHPQWFYFSRVGQRVDEHPPNGQLRWLDIGCGRHLIPLWMHRHAELEAALKSRPQSLVGLDPDLGALRDNTSLRSLINADAGRLPFADRSFDLVTSNMVFEHVADPLSVLREIRRVLAPGGRLILLTPNWLDIVTIVARMIPNRWHPAIMSRMDGRDEADVYPTLFRFNRPATIDRILREAGFARSSIELLEHPDSYGHAPLISHVESAWHRVARRWPALRGTLLVEAEAGR
jgi:ubiquinone/menaquinone biosynthesis C-methylase UbiE